MSKYPYSPKADTKIYTRKAFTTIRIEVPDMAGHFGEWEFDCKCGARGKHWCNGLPLEGMDERLIIFLELLRERLGSNPMSITSGFRCPKYNRAGQKVSSGGYGLRHFPRGARNSQHTQATAADIRVKKNKTRYHPPAYVAKVGKELIRELKNDPRFKGIGFGVGIYDGWTHFDTRPGYRVASWDSR